MDIVDPAKRSQMMARIKSTNTRPELSVRKFLHSAGFRYRLGTKIRSIKPDLVLPRFHSAIFVHGCFWHRHEFCKYTTIPKTNVSRWQNKFEANMERDRRIIRLLQEAGWRIAIIWECWEKRKLDIFWLADWIRSGNDPFVSWPVGGEINR